MLSETGVLDVCACRKLSNLTVPDDWLPMSAVFLNSDNWLNERNGCAGVFQSPEHIWKVHASGVTFRIATGLTSPVMFVCVFAAARPKKLPDVTPIGWSLEVCVFAAARSKKLPDVTLIGWSLGALLFGSQSLSAVIVLLSTRRVLLERFQSNAHSFWPLWRIDLANEIDPAN